MVGINENGQNETMLFNGSRQFTSVPTVFKNTPPDGESIPLKVSVSAARSTQGQGDLYSLPEMTGICLNGPGMDEEGEMTWQGRSTHLLTTTCVMRSEVN